MLGLKLLTFYLVTTSASITDYISKNDLKPFFPELMGALSDLSSSSTKADLPTVYFGSKGFDILKESLPLVVKLNTCAFVIKKFDNDSPENTFYAIATWKIMKCSILPQLERKDPNLHNAGTVKALKAVLENDQSSATDIRFSLETLKLVDESISNPNKISQTLQARVKEDDSLINIGQALHAVSFLGHGGQFLLQYVEDVVVQADEVDGRLLQWEGGLTVTSLLLTGLLKLQGAKPFTQTQADKFASYLLTRKTVLSPKGIVALVEASIALSESDVSPVSITFAKSSYVTTENPNLKLQISNLFGQPVKPSPTPVIAQSATRVTDDVVVLSKQPLTAGASAIEYELPLSLDPGQYRVGITAGSHSAALIVRILGPISLQWLEAGLGDADGSSALRLTKLQHPDKLPSALQADSSQHLIVRFLLSHSVQQPFLRLSSGNQEIIFVAEQDSSKTYKVDVNIASELTYSGAFDMELIVGDSIVSNPLRWRFGTVDVKLTSAEVKRQVVRGPRPEIRHMFRPAEKRPPQVVSMLFTALAAAPLLLLLILWLKLDFKLTNFNVAALAFHIGLASIFGLFTLFWLKLDMFITCGWLLPIGGFTFLAGHQVLSKLAKQKK